MNESLYEAGLKTRREVLGDAYVDASLANADEFGQPLQELVTQYCWGDIWNRQDLDRKTRSLLNLAMLTALNRSQELRAHIRGAINNGASKAEIREVFLQAAVYCGVPSGVESFRAAREVFKDMGL